MATMRTSFSREAVVLGCSLNGLGVVRSLGSAGIRTTVVGTRYTGAALWSRHASSRLIRSYTGDDFVEDMVALGKTFSQPPALFLTLEETVHSVSENREELSKWFRFTLPDRSCVEDLSDKSTFHRFCLIHGFPVPRSVVLETPQDVEMLADFTFPCVLKPDDKRAALSGKIDRAVRADTLADVRERVSSTLDAGTRIVAQEWINGPDSNIYFTLFYRSSDGRVAAAFTGRKLSSEPVNVGSTAICVAAPEARSVLEPITLDFAERANLVGMASMEYKWDESKKQFFMVEPTIGRTDWQEEIATLCGTNIPAAAFFHDLGTPLIQGGVALENVAWRATISEVLPSHLRSSVSRFVDGYFRWDDPLPALQHYLLVNPLRRLMITSGKRARLPQQKKSFGGKAIG